MSYNKPKISIITVCYNSAKTIRKTIESVLNQSYTNLEYVFVDGGSTDNTLVIIKEYQEKFIAKGMQYQFISEPDNGIYDAMNKAIRLASGEWLNIQGSDDWLELHACQYVVDALNDTDDVDIVYGMTRYIRNGQVLKVNQDSHDFLEVSTINHQAIFIKRTLHDKYGYYSMEYPICGDYEFLLRVRYKARFLRLESVFCNYSLSGFSSINRDKAVYENNLIKNKYNLISNKRLIYTQISNSIKKLINKFL